MGGLGLGTLTVFFAQLAGQGGIGAWPIGVSGVITSYIALLAYLQRADTHITRADWLFFFAALSALPFWFFTSNPLWAVVSLTVVDVLGFGPTVRKAYRHPHEESAKFFCALCRPQSPRHLGFGALLAHHSLVSRSRRTGVPAASFYADLPQTFTRVHSEELNPNAVKADESGEAQTSPLVAFFTHRYLWPTTAASRARS